MECGKVTEILTMLHNKNKVLKYRLSVRSLNQKVTKRKRKSIQNNNVQHAIFKNL